MPRIIDNIDQQLLPLLRESIGLSHRGDFCVGYFNLRGWKAISDEIENWSGESQHTCRLLIGMNKLPQDELKDFFSAEKPIDTGKAVLLKRQLAENFKDQLALGAPTDEDEIGLRKLSSQLKNGKVKVKLFLRYPLHAKLYLLFRSDPQNPAIGYLGSSNLTLAGLRQQGELNVDILDQDACDKLAKWFEVRWKDRLCLDITPELAEIIDSSWAGDRQITPYLIYLKMAYHLSQEARSGLSEFSIPLELEGRLFEFQKAAVKIASHHAHRRGGVLLGDVVGLGKSHIASTVARVFDDLGYDTLVISPKNLVPMWESYKDIYRFHGKVISISRVATELPTMRRYRLVIIDESHNLRNKSGQRYKLIKEYIEKNDSKVILLSATPFNKSYLDLSGQLGLFIESDKDLGVKPLRAVNELGESEFVRRYQCGIQSLTAFEKSSYPDDWRELMRLYMVRRTRGFIKAQYAKSDRATGRKYLEFPDSTRSYFPDRIPKKMIFSIDDSNPSDQYAQLYSPQVIEVINNLSVPRYGLGNYLASTPSTLPTQSEAKVISDLSRAGKYLKGFCRTNLYKRLESGGYAFMESLKRHVVRNYIFLHALEHNLPLPIGPQDIDLMDTRLMDADYESIVLDETGEAETINVSVDGSLASQARKNYELYESKYKNRFKWLGSHLFTESLKTDLRHDANNLDKILSVVGEWDWSSDSKCAALVKLVKTVHPDHKIIIFTQFADTVRYLKKQLMSAGISAVAGVTGDADNPTAYAWRFSPVSNEKTDQVSASEELRVLVATDVLSEGQNLQDCHIVVNYDLPWAIIRLIQRVGRVDRIGQIAEQILCYSFLPADGVEKILNLRSRVRQRLKQNAEVVGTDENFFEDDRNDQAVVDLYNEKSGILDGDDDEEIDLSSRAYQIWKNATEHDSTLAKTVIDLPSVVYSTKSHTPSTDKPSGVLVYTRTGDGTDSLSWLDEKGNSVTDSQLEILKTAACEPTTSHLARLPNHHQLVSQALTISNQQSRTANGGQLGRPTGPRYRAYERLKRYLSEVQGTLFESDSLVRAVDSIYQHPLTTIASEILTRQLKLGMSDPTLAELVISLHTENRLVIFQPEGTDLPAQIICSLGLRAAS